MGDDEHVRPKLTLVMGCEGSGRTGWLRADRRPHPEALRGARRGRRRPPRARCCGGCATRAGRTSQGRRAAARRTNTSARQRRPRRRLQRNGLPIGTRFVETPHAGGRTPEHGIGYRIEVAERGKRNLELGIDAERPESPLQEAPGVTDSDGKEAPK